MNNSLVHSHRPLFIRFSRVPSFTVSTGYSVVHCDLPLLLREPSLGPSLSTKPNILGLRSVFCSDQRHRFISISRKSSSSRRRVADFFLCPRANDPCLPLLLRQRTRSSQSAQSVFADVSSPPSGSDVIDGFPSSGHYLRVNAWRHAIPLTRNVSGLRSSFM